MNKQNIIGGVMKYNLLLCILIVLVIPFSQVSSQHELLMQEIEGRRERLETMRIWKMTEFLDLSTEQSEKFFPMLREFEENVREEQKKQRKLISEIYTDYTPTESDVEKLISQLADSERNIINTKEKFIISLSEVLTPEQQIKYIVFDIRFRSDLVKSLQGPAHQMKPNKDERR
jgi:Spy/CpxP family protein refolding chaperone